jgi:transcriptional regulator NrdR family protein
MTNLMIPFECPICGSDGFRQVEVKDRDGRTRQTQAYECRGCSTMFRERERFTKHRLQVMGADGVDLKPELDKKRATKGAPS